MVHCKLKRIRLLSLTRTFSPMLENPRQSWILDLTPWIPDSRYWISDYLSVKLGFRIPNSEFQSLMGFRIFLSRIPDSTSKISEIQESGSPLHGRYFNMIVKTESITVTRNGKEPIPLYASITTHGETRTPPVQAWVNGEFPLFPIIIPTLDPVYTNPDIF